MKSSAEVRACATNNNAQGPFEAKINNWVEGTLMSIDADSAKLSIRGARRLYASEYAKMLKNIHAKTAKMTQAERKVKAAEIRESWRTALEKALTQDAEPDTDFTFHLPTTDHKFTVVDEAAFYQRATLSTGSTASLTDAECAAVHAMNDLKVGECVVVGYESGVLKNIVYAVIKATERMVSATHFATKS